MDLKAFSQKNRERCESPTPHGFNHKLTDWSLSDWMTAIMGELGEAANIVKKLNRSRDGMRGNTTSDEELASQLVRELADTFIYLDLMLQRLGLSTSHAIAGAFNAKSKQIGSPIRIEA